jgi:peptide/nickel transport system substrate-binding protein
MLGKRWWAIKGVLVLALMAAACGSGSKEKASTEASPSGGQAAATQASGGQQTAKVRRGGTLVYTLELNPKVFDPRVYTDVYSGRVVDQVFDPLVKVDEKLVPQPFLAEKIEQPDDVTYVIHLRKGVKFHDGTELDAEAVKFSVDRVREFKTGPSYPEAQYIVESTVVDKYVYKMVIKEPFAPWLNELAGRIGTIVSPTAVKTMGDDKFGLNPIGTGPFKFKEFKNDNLVRVERNPDYWRMGADGKALPYLDAVEMRVITEPANRLTAVQSGDVHIAEITEQDLPIVKKDPNLVWKQEAAFGWSSVILTVTKPPFDSRALRQAVAYAIDREEINQAIFEGQRQVAQGPMPLPHAWALDPSYKPFPYDQAKAKAKLVEGGKPNGFEFTFYTDGGSAIGRRQAELMQAQLARVGIKMNIEYADFNGVVIPKAKAQESGMFGISFNCGFDPDPCVSRRFLKGSGFNYMGYDNPQVNDLILKARATNNREERGKLYKQVVPLIVEDAPAIFTVTAITRYVGSKKVQNWHIYGLPRYTQGYSEYWLSE